LAPTCPTAGNLIDTLRLFDFGSLYEQLVRRGD
jgi:hypothetical protein